MFLSGLVQGGGGFYSLPPITLTLQLEQLVLTYLLFPSISWLYTSTMSDSEAAMPPDSFQVNVCIQIEQYT